MYYTELIGKNQTHEFVRKSSLFLTHVVIPAPDRSRGQAPAGIHSPDYFNNLDPSP